MRKAPGSLLLTALLVAGCGDEPAPAPDATTDAATTALTDIPWLAEGTPPIAPPVLTPCPEGWSELTDDDGTFCEPWPADTPPCGALEARFPGQEACGPVGSTCPADGLVADLPVDRPAIHVLSGATGGDGTRAAPYGSLTEFSIGRLRPGAIIALGRGSYDQPVRLPAGAALWGACVAETVVSSSSASSVEGVIEPVGADTELRNLRIGPSPRMAIFATGSGRGILVQDVWIESASIAAVVVAGDVVAEIRDLVVRDVIPLSSGLFGRGLSVQGGPEVRVVRASIAGAHDFAIGASEAGTTLDLVDVEVHDVQPNGLDGLAGHGILSFDGARITGSRVLVAGSAASGVTASAGSTTELTDAVVRDVNGASLPDPGRGLRAELGSNLSARRVLVERARHAGVSAIDPASTLVLEDAIVRDTDANEMGGFGRALDLNAQGTVRRAVFARSRGVAVFMSGATASFEDVRIHDAVADGLLMHGGHGLSFGMDSTVSVARVLIERATDVGLYGYEGSTLEGSDVVVRDVASSMLSGRLGRGLHLQFAAEVRLVRALFQRNRELSVGVIDESNATLEHVVIEDSLPAQCGDGRCPDPGGIGLLSNGARLELRHFAVRQSPVCGLMLANEGGIDLDRGEVSGHAIGACVQVDGYDFSRLMNEIVFFDNGANLQATSLPVPDASVGAAAAP